MNPGNQIVSHRVYLVACLVIGLLTFAALAAPLITRYGPNQQGDLLREKLLPPSAEHPFGTDRYARDIFSRVLYGGRISLLISISVVALSTLMGVFYGGIAGYVGSWLDTLMMRCLDLMLAFPAIFLIITLVSLYGSNLFVLVLVLAVIGWMGMARLVRAEVMHLKQKEFILACMALGLSPFKILTRHLFPNVLPTVLAVATIRIGMILLLESALSFLGLGVQPPTASWGSIIRDGQDVLMQAWWVSFFPGVAILVSVFCFNIIGEYLRQRESH